MKKRQKKIRPNEFKPRPVDRDRVMLYVAAGLSEPAIATVLGICQNTLRKHFAAELLHGHSCKKAENLARLERAAKKGNVTAMKFLESKYETLPPEAPPPPKEAKLGKKEIANQEAQTAHEETEWGKLLN
jgi:hypothetical protein